jgi:hypothetical protein
MKHIFLHPIFWVFFLWITPISFGQSVGNCTTGRAQQYLDANNVRARMLNTGGLFWNGDPNVYTVPKGGKANAIFASGFWLGGYDEQNKLHIAAATFGNWEFWPGPLDANGNPPSDCSKYDRIWKVNQSDIRDYERGNTPAKDLLEWPRDLGASVIDGDGNPNNYNLAGGDRPEMLGDQVVWWIMNDMGNKHVRTGSDSLPVGIEVRVTAFASMNMAETTFYRYQIKYKGKQPLHNTIVSMYADIDMGSSSDDHVGSDTTMALGYAYNMDDDDEGDGNYNYGTPPPSIGYVLLKTPTQNGKETGMGYLYSELKGSPICGDAAAVGIEYYYQMTARCKDGTYHIPFTSYRTQISPSVKYDFPGDPITGQGWSEENIDGKGTPMSTKDSRFVISSGMFDMKPNDEQTFAFAIVWARSDSRFASLAKMKRLSKSIYQRREGILVNGVPVINFGSPGTEYVETVIPLQQPLVLYLRQNAPNPASGEVNIPFYLPYADHITMKLYDVLGREVATIMDEKREAGSHTVHFDTHTLRSGGVYLCRLIAHESGLSTSMRMTVVK